MSELTSTPIKSYPLPLPYVKSYGKYSGQNYGINTLLVSLGQIDLYYSYRTIVAFRDELGLMVRQNDWNVTTGKHLNWIDGGNKKERVTREIFQAALQASLDKHFR